MPDVDDKLADAIYARSVAEADGQGIPDWIEDGDGGMWLPGNRGQAIAFYAGEHGVGFTQVRARRQYMRIDYDAIRDLATDYAQDLADGHYAPEDMPEIAYTYEDEGWRWEACGKDDERAIGLWYCEIPPTTRAASR